MTPDVKQTIELVTIALGEPIMTPRVDLDGRPHNYRVFHWECPVCECGQQDPEGFHRPLSIDTDGNLCCFSGCSPKQISEAVEKLITTRLAVA